jgi:hypothetical protein
MESIAQENEIQKKGFRGIHVFWIVIGTILLTVALTFWVVRTYIYAKDFKPVELNQKEQTVLHGKLRALGYDPDPVAAAEADKETDQQWLRSERYKESLSKGVLSFSERELNSLLTKNPDLAKRVAVNLSDDMVSARILVPLDPDFPLLGGKTLRVSTGLEMAYLSGRPKIILKGVSIMGVPIPNSWLGGLKNVDLIGEFGDDQGFWSAFAQGVEDIQVQDGELSIKLKQ